MAGDGASEMRRTQTLPAAQAVWILAREPRVAGVPDGIRWRRVGRRQRTAGPPTVESRWVMSRTDERTTTGDHAEQAFKHRARDALDLADLRLFGLQHASMLRGVEVRGSDRT